MQLTSPGTPQRNVVSERRNHTLLDMVRSIMSLADLPLSFWSYALETVAFTLNRAPSKSIGTTSTALLNASAFGLRGYVETLSPLVSMLLLIDLA